MTDEKKQNITKLIETIRQDIQTDNFESLRSLVEELKVAMKDMIQIDTAEPLSDL